MKDEYTLAEHPVYHYRFLDPLPTEQALAEFYRDRYYQLIREGSRAPHLKRLMSGTADGASELAWFRETYYSDLHDIIEEFSPDRRVLEIGCGPGDLLQYLRETGFDVEGVEPSGEAAKLANAKGLKVRHSTLQKYRQDHADGVHGSFGSVLLMNVLEHVPDPVETVQAAKDFLRPDGLLCVRVPNDFSEIQEAATKHLKKEPWWITVPDHINYFSFRTLGALLEGEGFEVIYSQSDFPMEFFLFMGQDYVGNSEIGKRCHQQRVALERGLPKPLRRRMYEALARAEIGRTCLLCGRLGRGTT